MPTRDQVLKALRNADKAGDTAAAQQLARRIQAMDAATPAAQPPDPTRPAEYTPEQMKIRDAYDNLPWYLKAAQAADDVMRTTVEGIGQGYGDKAAAKLNEWFGGKPYDTGLAEQRIATNAAQTRAGGAGVAAQVAGAVAGPGKLSVLGKVLPKVPGLLPRVVVGAGLGAGEGAAVGAVNAAGHDEDVADGAISGALWGTPIGGLSPVISSMGRAATGPRLPSVDKLRTAKNDAYAAANGNGVRYQPSQIDPHIQAMDAELVGANIDPELHKNAYKILNKNVKGMSGSQSFNDLDQLRQVITRDVDGSAGERFMRQIMRKHVDNMIDSNPDPRIQQARTANRIYKNRQSLEGALDKAENTAGGNPQNRAATAVLGDKNAPFVNPTEKAAVRRYTAGTTLGSIGSTLDKFKWAGAPVGAAIGGLWGPLGAGAGATGGMAATSGVGKVLKAIDDVRNLKDARRVISGQPSRRYGTDFEDVLRRLGILSAVSAQDGSQ